MSELFREIQEDIRRERLGNLWKTVGRFAVIGSIGIVVITAIFVVRDGYKESAAEEYTTKLLRGTELLTASDYKAAIASFAEITEDTSSPSYPLAMLKKAQAQELSGDKEAAKKTYAELATSKSEYAELAAMQADPMSAKTDGVFAQTAKENKAWALLAAGKKEEAITLFSELIKDENSPLSLAQRASEVLRIIAPEKLK